MSDTDSSLLPYPLPNHLVGKGLGQMKLETVINEGLLIRKKLYCILNSDDKVIIKSSGMDSSYLNYKLFKILLSGQSIEIERTNFNVEWNNLNINVEKSKIIVQGLQSKIKTIYNTPDVNFKYISFPINYNVIVYSAQEKFLIINSPSCSNKKLIIIYKPKTYSIIEHPLYALSEYICWLIKLFFIFYFFYTEECDIK